MAVALSRPPGHPPRPRTHAGIDADLVGWTEVAARMGASIEGLTQDPAFLRLKTQGRLGALAGITRARADTAAAEAERLWSLYLALDRRLTEAADLRRSSNPFGREERFEKIAAILDQPCVTLPASAQAPRRVTLAGDPDPLATLGEVRAAMEAAFDDLRDTVLAAAEAWAGAPGLKTLGEAINRLKGEADALGCPRPRSLADASNRLDAALANLEADPLGARDASAEIAALIAEADRALAGARADRAAAKAFLAKAEARLAELRALRQRAGEVRALRLARIADPPPLADLPPAPGPDLQAWLATLAKTARDGRPHATLIGAASWTARADAHQATLAAMIAEDQRLLDTREDLRGRFSALAAKAEARAAGGAVSPEASALFQAARALLFAAATPLPHAIALLRQCEKLQTPAHPGSPP